MGIFIETHCKWWYNLWVYMLRAVYLAVLLIKYDNTLNLGKDYL